jgi:uroporphyrinogen III methyltransferase/synthase
LDHFDWIVFSSSNGVRYFLERLLETGGDMRRLGRVRLAEIGPGTAEKLADFRLRADLIPNEFRAEALAEALVAAEGQSFLLIRASRGREILAERLRAAGREVDQVVTYRSSDVERPVPEVASALAAGDIAWVTVTSSAIGRSLVALFGNELRRAKLASISPVTTATLDELGYQPSVEATDYTMPGLVEAILRHGAPSRT